MMLEHLGENAAAAMMASIEDFLASTTGRTRDLKGEADTETCGKAIAAGI